MKILSNLTYNKITLACSAVLLSVYMLAGCAGVSDVQLKKGNLFRDEIVGSSEAVADYDALVFKSSDAEIYGQILMPGQTFGAKRRPCVLMFHGFAGFGRFDDIGQALCRAGCVVLIPHHRGAWGSHGKYSISNSVKDAVNLVHYVKSPDFQAKYHVNPNAVFLLGHSMGGNTALNAAAEVSGVRGLVMLAPCDIGTMYQQMSKDEMRKFMIDNGLEVLKTDGFEAVYKDLAEHASEYAFPNAAQKLNKVNLFLVMGEWDTCISNELLKVFYDAARGNKTLPYCLSKNYKSRHGLMGARTQLSMDIADFILKSLE
ncbi:MAG: alpha/beta fold hydrolase [Victivallales bacterium]|nr:alpha/beta fold hydrolase [Victivallales bacterium]